MNRTSWIKWSDAGLLKRSAGFALVIFLVILASCKSYKEQDAERTDTPKRGTIHVSADESFKPVIDAQVQVYEANNPDAHILVDYKPEAECLKDFGNDSVRMVISTRKFSTPEQHFMIDSMQVTPRATVMARDAIAVIVNPGAPDSLFTMQELKDILTGKNNNLLPVFDGVQATSTVRYIVDSVLVNETLSKSAVAATSSEGVIDYVSRNPKAIGFIGVSWIGNREDPQQVSFLKKVKIAQLESTDIDGSYVLPVQANIYLKRYPMVRDLVYVLKEKTYRGLGYGFADFMDGQVGQLIFKRAYLVPVHRNFILRPVQLRND